MGERWSSIVSSNRKEDKKDSSEMRASRRSINKKGGVRSRPSIFEETRIKREERKPIASKAFEPCGKRKTP